MYSACACSYALPGSGTGRSSSRRRGTGTAACPPQPVSPDLPAPHCPHCPHCPHSPHCPHRETHFLRRLQRHLRGRLQGPQGAPVPQAPGALGAAPLCSIRQCCHLRCGCWSHPPSAAGVALSAPSDAPVHASAPHPQAAQCQQQGNPPRAACQDSRRPIQSLLRGARELAPELGPGHQALAPGRRLHGDALRSSRGRSTRRPGASVAVGRCTAVWGGAPPPGGL